MTPIYYLPAAAFHIPVNMTITATIPIPYSCDQAECFQSLSTIHCRHEVCTPTNSLRQHLRRQVAQLCRETARSLKHFRLTSSVICKIMHKIACLGLPMGQSGAISGLYLKVLTQRNFIAEFHRENVSFTRNIANWRFCATFLGGLEVT